MGVADGLLAAPPKEGDWTEELLWDNPPSLDAPGLYGRLLERVLRGVLLSLLKKLGSELSRVDFLGAVFLTSFLATSFFIGIFFVSAGVLLQCSNKFLTFFYFFDLNCYPP